MATASAHGGSSGNCGDNDDAEEEHTCPICLEGIFQPTYHDGNGNDNHNIDSIAHTSSTSTLQPVGATVPCGHLFHVVCFSGWQASRLHLDGGRGVKCPTCNVKTTMFVKLFLPEGLARGGGATGSGGGRYGGGDDDISISSIEEEEEDDDDDDDENDDDSDESGKGSRIPDDGDGQDETPVVGGIEEDSGVEDASRNEDPVVNDVDTDIIEILDDGDDESLTQQQNAQQNNAQIVDLTRQAETTQPTATQSKSRKRRRSEQHGTESQQHEPDDISRLTRIAKKFKRQYLQKNAQYKLQYEEKKKLSNRVRQSEGDVKRLKNECSEHQAARNRIQLLYNESSMETIRMSMELDTIKTERNKVDAHNKRLINDMATREKSYKIQLERERAKSMSEVKQILEEHPQLVQENARLKEQLKRTTYQLQRTSYFSSSSSSHLQRQSSLSDHDRKGNDSHKTREQLQALREMDCKVRNQFQSKSPPSSHSNGTFEPAAKKTGPSLVSAARYSGSASRMLAASTSLKKAKQKQQQKTTSLVQGLVGNVPSVAGGMHYKDPCPKRPVSSVVPTASTFMSLSTSTKKIKTSSASRRDFFHRKPSKSRH